MASIQSFEELQVWQKARIVCQRIYNISCAGSFAKDFSLRDQINRAAGSIIDNIAEGFERGGRNEFIQFLSIAKGSAGEVRSQLYRALDRNHIAQNGFTDLSEIVTEVSRMTSALVNYLNNTDLKGTKYMQEPEIFYGPFTTDEIAEFNQRPS